MSTKWIKPIPYLGIKARLFSQIALETVFSSRYRDDDLNTENSRHAHNQHFLRHFDPDVLERSRAAAFSRLYAEDEVLINIQTLEILEGSMPRRALALVLEWAQEHRAELLEDWELCSHNQHPKKIRPLA